MLHVQHLLAIRTSAVLSCNQLQLLTGGSPKAGKGAVTSGALQKPNWTPARIGIPNADIATYTVAV